jgi:hypothetical protein
MQADLARMPTSERAQMEAMMAGQLDEMVRRSAGTAEFRPDGTVLFEGVEGDRQTGRWTIEGDRMRLVTEGDPPFVGTLEGDTMRLEPEGEAEISMEYVLKRQ